MTQLDRIDITRLEYSNPPLNEIETIYSYVEEEKPLLYLAIEKGEIDIIKLLLSNRYIDVNIKYFQTNSKLNQKYDEKI